MWPNAFVSLHVRDPVIASAQLDQTPASHLSRPRRSLAPSSGMPCRSVKLGVTREMTSMFDEVRIPRLVIAGAHSGAGKTTVALGLVTALGVRGRTVQTFKVGPDLIDSAYLSHASRRPCRNLDAWMLGPAGLRRSLAQGVMNADCAVIEGVMGLFDGHGLSSD